MRSTTPSSGEFSADVEWKNSYEAEQHVHHYGPAEEPVCWSLVGYISGYASACLGQEVYFREQSCSGQGGTRCKVRGMDADRWGDALADLRFDFQGADLSKEIERLRTAAKRQVSELARRERALEKREREVDLLRARIARHAAARNFVAGGPAMQEVLELAARVAPLDTTVLVYGESGTGKEFIVRLIHDQSPRATGPFVSVNCAALTETLLESELFGHVRGSFTGAVRDKAGLFEVAAGGTLFLDEIGEVAPTIQAKLLRALQEREIRRVGSERTVKVNVRVVAATNRDLKAAVAAGEFREDLYFRLAGFTITVPPLRDRREDIPALAHEFLRRSSVRIKKDVKSLSADAMTALVNYAWPGNVRELENAIERRRDPRARRNSGEARAAPGSDLTAAGADHRHARPQDPRTRADRPRPGAPQGQPPTRRQSAEHQHRDAVAEDEGTKNGIGKREDGKEHASAAVLLSSGDPVLLVQHRLLRSELFPFSLFPLPFGCSVDADFDRLASTEHPGPFPHRIRQDHDDADHHDDGQ